MDYDESAFTYNEPTRTYDGLLVGLDPYVLVRFTTSSPKRLSLVRSGIGAKAGFRPAEGWEIVSKRFSLPLGTRDSTMATVRTVWLANRDASTATLKAALDAELATNSYAFPGDTVAPAAS